MIKPTHTPGPWQIEVEDIHDPHPIYGWPAEKIGEVLYLVIGDEKIELARDGYGCSDDKFKQKVAIAQTHIAAPDMKEALECINDAIYCGNGVNFALKKKWDKKYHEAFGASLNTAQDLGALSMRLRRQALDKANGKSS